MPGNDSKIGGKRPYGRKNPFDRHGAEQTRLPDHELRTKSTGGPSQTGIVLPTDEPRFGNIGEVIQALSLIHI